MATESGGYPLIRGKERRLVYNLLHSGETIIIIPPPANNNRSQVR